MFFSLGVTLKAQETKKARVYVEDPREKFAFGIKGGLNYSDVWDQTENFTAEPKIGLAGGLYLGIPLGKYLGIQPEILISQKGLKGSGMLFESNYSFKRTSTYIDIPLQVQMKPTENLTIVFGPQFSSLLEEKNVYSFGENSSMQDQAFKNENSRDNIFGFVVGPDIIISHLVISGRIGWDLQDYGANDVSTTPQYKNQWMQLTAGFKL